MNSEGQPELSDPVRPVEASHWDDEWVPSAPGHLSAREAAVAILSEMDWDIVLEGASACEPLNHLEWLGLLGLLYVDWERPTRRRWVRPGDFHSHLLAYVAARLERTWICDAEGHEMADGLSPFGDCWGDEDDEPHNLHTVWMLPGHASDFAALAVPLGMENR